jgi:hypothetical protein
MLDALGGSEFNVTIDYPERSTSLAKGQREE